MSGPVGWANRPLWAKSSLRKCSVGMSGLALGGHRSIRQSEPGIYGWDRTNRLVRQNKRQRIIRVWINPIEALSARR